MRNILLVILFLSSGFAFAGNGIGNNDGDAKKVKTYSISGKVVDNSGELIGVTVIIDNQPTVVYTDFDGNFTIDNVVEGSHIIRFSMVAYEEKEVKVNADGSNFDLAVQLYGR